jgi:ribosomal protein S27E
MGFGLNYYILNYFSYVKKIYKGLEMTVKKPEPKDEMNAIVCPNCRAKITIAELGMVMFKSATVFSCPVCSKTIAVQPKGDEFELKIDDDETNSKDSNEKTNDGSQENSAEVPKDE